jgi:hypothetical protein
LEGTSIKATMSSLTTITCLFHLSATAVSKAPTTLELFGGLGIFLLSS